MSAAASADDRVAIMARAEADLARGDALGATLGFERAAAMLHAADSEMGLVSAAMQRGEYRQALAFAAHVAGAHLDAPAAAVQYAWLLRIGGQPAIAARVMADALARARDDAVVEAAGRALDAPLPSPSGILLETSQRLAPASRAWAGDLPVPAGARVVSSGVLLPGGSHALVPAPREGPSTPSRWWVRNGLGETRVAELEAIDGPAATKGIVVLRLSAPLDAPGAGVLSARAPFAGSPAFAIEYAESDQASPAWPWLRTGFLGASVGDAGWSRLGIEVAAARSGGPVLDAAGDLAGMVVRGSDGQALMLPVSMWPSLAGAAVLVAARGTQGAPRLLSADLAYERALRLALQVIASP